MANRILVVDDNSDIRENICEYLNLRGHQTIGASDAASAAQLIAEEDIARIVLDVGLPGEDGMSFCRRLRLAGSSILILMLTARDAVDDRVAGLESGADDYVIKPFSLLELNARVEALLRRAGLSGVCDCVQDGQAGVCQAAGVEAAEPQARGEALLRHLGLRDRQQQDRERTHSVCTLSNQQPRQQTDRP